MVVAEVRVTVSVPSVLGLGISQKITCYWGERLASAMILQYI